MKYINHQALIKERDDLIYQRNMSRDNLEFVLDCENKIREIENKLKEVGVDPTEIEMIILSQEKEN